MTATAPQKIAVLGAGIVGVSTAEWLRRDGATVELIDRVQPGDPAQASFGNAGILARASVVPVAVPGLLKKVPKMLFDPDGPLFLRWSYLPRLAPWLLRFLRNGNESKVREIADGLSHIIADSVDQHLALAKGTPAEAYICSGAYAFLFRSREAFEKDKFAFALRKAHGFSWQERTREDLVAEDPGLGEAYQFGAFFDDHGWISDPGAYVAAIARDFQRHGGTFWQTEVKGIRPLEGSAAVKVQADGETRHYDRIVVATGAWSAKLANSLGHRIPLESERGYHLVFKGASTKPPQPYALTDAKLVATPMDGGLRCAGLVEFAGLEAGPSQAPLGLIERAVKRLYPDLAWDGIDSWLGHRPAPVDSLPLLGESTEARGIYFAFGTHHIGLTAGPKIGRLTADLIAGRQPNFAMTPYHVGRFD